MRWGLVAQLAALGLAAYEQGEPRAGGEAPGTWGEASRLCAMGLTAEPELASDAVANPSGEAAGEAADTGAADAQKAADEQAH